MKVRKGVELNVIPIKDPFGPTKDDGTIDGIVCSSETYSGCLKINNARKEANLNELEIYRINVIANTQEKSDDPTVDNEITTKMSSTFLRSLIAHNKNEIN